MKEEKKDKKYYTLYPDTSIMSIGREWKVKNKLVEVLIVLFLLSGLLFFSYIAYMIIKTVFGI